MFTTLNFWLWAAQVVLALLYAFAGVQKVAQSPQALEPRMGAWVTEYSPGMVKFIGIAEILGAIGLILPIWTGILPWLTPLAAIGLSIIQVLAIVTHLRAGEARVLPVNVILLALSLFVVWGRWDLIA